MNKTFTAAIACASIAFAVAPTPANAQGLQCTTFVKDQLAKTRPTTDFSGLSGNAGQWAKAATTTAGSKAVTKTPSKGAIMVFAGNGDKANFASGTKFAAGEYGHVAVVRGLYAQPEIISVDHANWNSDGKIHLRVPVKTSDGWKTASVWNVNTNAWGGGKYAVAGFIDPSKFPAKKK